MVDEAKAADTASDVPFEKEFVDLWQQISSYWTAQAAPTGGGSIEGLNGVLNRCKPLIEERCKTVNLIVDANPNGATGAGSVTLRVYDRGCNQQFRSLLNHIQLDQMAEEGDVSNYFSILDKLIDQAKNRVTNLRDSMQSALTEAGGAVVWLNSLQTIDETNFSRFGLYAEGRALQLFVSRGGDKARDNKAATSGPALKPLNRSDWLDLTKPATSEGLIQTLSYFRKRLNLVAAFLDNIAVKDAIESKLKPEVQKVEDESKGFLALLTGNKGIVVGALAGAVVWAAGHSYFEFWVPWQSARRLTWLAVAAAVGAIVLAKLVDRSLQKRRVEAIRSDVKNQIRRRLNPYAFAEYERTPRNILDELTVSLDQAPVLENWPSGDTSSELTNANAAELLATKVERLKHEAKSSSGLAHRWWLNHRVLWSKLALVRQGLWQRLRKLGAGLLWFGAAASLTVMLSLLPAILSFGSYGAPRLAEFLHQGIIAAVSKPVTLLAQSPGRELCAISSGRLQSQDDRFYYVLVDSTQGTELPVEVPKSAVAKIVNGEAGGVRPCQTVDDTYRSVLAPVVKAPDVVNRIENNMPAPSVVNRIENNMPAPSIPVPNVVNNIENKIAVPETTPPAVTANFTAPISVIDLPKSGSGAGSGNAVTNNETTITTTMLPAVTYFIVDGQPIVVHPPDGRRYLFMPLFDGEVRNILDPGKRKQVELTNALRHYYESDGRGGWKPVSGKPVEAMRAFVQGVHDSVKGCLADGARIELDVMGFASPDWQYHSSVNKDDELNLRLAEGRRQLVIDLLKEANDPAITVQPVIPAAGTVGEEATFRFPTIELMTDEMKKWFEVTRSDQLAKVFQRSVVIAYPEAPLRPGCRSPEVRTAQ